MAKKKRATGEVNKSQAIRDLLKENPKIKASEVVAALAAKGLQIRVGLFYMVKGRLAGNRKRRPTIAKGTHAAVVTKSDALSTIRKVQGVASEVGGLRVLKQIIDALSE